MPRPKQIPIVRRINRRRFMEASAALAVPVSLPSLFALDAVPAKPFFKTRGIILRTDDDPKASLAHLAYLNTISPPKVIRPEPGIFLEFAPIRRRFDQPLKNADARANENSMSHGETLEKLDENLTVFDASTDRICESLCRREQPCARKEPRVAV